MPNSRIEQTGFRFRMLFMAMRKKMEEVEVAVQDDGSIFITQPMHGNDDAIVSISPEQVDTLVKWLKEAEKEALEMRKNGIPEPA
jgi:hypothetical protein